MNKKAQVTIFVILAILIVAVIIIFFAVRNSIVDTSNKIPIQIIPIYDFVTGCIEDSGYNALYTIGQQGGYFIPSTGSLEFGVPYYIFDADSIEKLKQNEVRFYNTREILEKIKEGKIQIQEYGKR